MAMLEEAQRGRRQLVKAHPPIQKEAELFHTTGGLPLFQQRCGLYEFPNNGSCARSPSTYRNLSANMESVRDSFLDKKPLSSPKKTNILNCYTSGAEALAELSRTCPSYGSSNSSRSGLSSSFSSSIIGSPNNSSMNRSGMNASSRASMLRF